MRETAPCHYRIVLALSCLSLLWPALAGADDPLQYTVYSNVTDPHLVRAERPDGTVIDWFGLRDEDGVPKRVQTILVTTALNEQYRMDLNESGALTLLADSNGMKLEFAWRDACNAIVTVTIVDANVPVSGQIAWSQCPDFGPGIDLGVDTVEEPLPLSVLGSDQGEVIIRVTECDGPLESRRPEIYVLVENVSTGTVIGRIPARWWVGSGIYRAVVPTGQEVVTRSPEFCEKTATVIGTTCDALLVVSAPNPAAAPAAICTPLCMATAFFPVLTPLCWWCPPAVGAVVTACEASGPVSDVAQGLCDAVFEDSVAAELRLTAIAPHEPGRYVGDSVVVSSEGPFPLILSIDVTIESLCSPGPGDSDPGPGDGGGSDGGGSDGDDSDGDDSGDDGSGDGCPPGTIFNPFTGRCEADSGDDGSGGGCPAGTIFNPFTGECVADPGDGDSGGGCPDGTIYNPFTGECEEDGSEFCGPGQTLNPITGECEDDPDADDCPEGQEINPATGLCGWPCDNGLWYDWEKDACVDACGQVPPWPCPEGSFPDPIPQDYPEPCLTCDEARQSFCQQIAERPVAAANEDWARYWQATQNAALIAGAMRCAGCFPPDQILPVWDQLVLECSSQGQE